MNHFGSLNMFLNYQNDSNYGYAVFGEMIDGFEVLDKIAAVKTGNRGYFADWPVDDVIIEKVTIEE